MSQDLPTGNMHLAENDISKQHLEENLISELDLEEVCVVGGMDGDPPSTWRTCNCYLAEKE